MNSPGSFCTSVLETRDPVRAARFYLSLLGWEAKPATPLHTFLQCGGKTVASIQRISSGHDAWIPHTIVSVDDCDATMSRAPRLGGETGFVHTVPKHGRIGSIVDPGGAFHALRGPVPTA